MADQLQLRGGTTAQTATFTGALREVTVDTDKDTLVVHDNALAGGYPLLRQDLSNLPAGTIDNADINASAAIVDTKLATIATAGKVSNSATTATNANTASAIVARDASGNFTAGTITAALTGAASSNVLKAGDTMTGVLAVTAGTEALPGIAVSGDLNTGFSTNTSMYQVEGNGAGTSSARASIALINNNVNTDDDSSYLILARSYGSTVGANNLVTSGGRLGQISFQGADGTDFVEGASIQAFVDGTSGANDLPTRLVFSTTRDSQSSPLERMRITNLGETAIGTTNNGLFVGTTQGAGTTYALFIGRRSITEGSAFTTGSTISFLVWSNGNVVNTNNSYGAISDIKLKENIVDASSQWDDLKALQVRNYNFKEGQTHTQIGLVAQEVELVSPGLVSESPDRDEEGNDLGTVTKSVNYSVLYMKAVKALQEAMERIEATRSPANCIT
jgi:hypothetical protein